MSFSCKKQRYSGLDIFHGSTLPIRNTEANYNGIKIIPHNCATFPLSCFHSSVQSLQVNNVYMALFLWAANFFFLPSWFSKYLGAWLCHWSLWLITKYFFCFLSHPKAYFCCQVLQFLLPYACCKLNIQYRPK